jgi:hypothetical protein
MIAVALENEDQEHLDDDLVVQIALPVAKEVPVLQVLEQLGPT